MCRRTIYDARNNFSALVKLAESGEPVELTRHDKPVAVIISWEDYEKQCKPKKDEYPDEEYDKKIAKLWGEE